jgi:putative ABC transport system substrate-binding protein
MRRREFIAGLGGTGSMAARGAGAAGSDAGGGISFPSSAEEVPSLVAAFRKCLGETGYVEGRNVAIDFRWAENAPDRLPEFDGGNYAINR